MIPIAALILALTSLLPAANLGQLNEGAYQKLVASQKGKVLLVNFWATYCVPCRAEMPALVKMQERLRSRGFLLVTISADEPEDEGTALKFLETTKVPAPHYIRKAKNDEAFINFIDPKWSGALPASILYDRAGKKVRLYVGEADLKALEAAITKLL